VAKLFTPREYQTPVIKHIVENKRCNVWLPMGMGKTVSTLMAIDILKTAGVLENPVLILAPLRVAQSTWPDEIEKWTQTTHLKVQPIIGNETKRFHAVNQKADVFTMNYENLTWLVSHWRKLKKWPYDMIVADESTKLKSFRTRQGGKRAKELSKVAFYSPRFVNLTGTPAPNGVVDLWGQNWFLDAGACLGRSFSAFEKRWFYTGYDGFSKHPHKHSQAEIENLILHMTICLKAEEYFDVEKPIETTIPIKLPHKAQKAYNEMEALFYTELSEDEEIEAANAAVKSQKLLQIANGAPYTKEDRTEWNEIHSEKLYALESIVEESNGMPVLVAYHFKSDLARLQKHFPKARLLDKDPQTIRDWNAGKIPILLAHPASAGHGLNLQDGGNILVFYSVNWNLENHQQIIERIGPVRQLQAGHNRPVYIYYILAENTIEQDVLTRLQTKADVQYILMGAMSRYRQKNKNI
jgi:SNF2 family DNA or RNA helicase